MAKAAWAIITLSALVSLSTIESAAAQGRVLANPPKLGVQQGVAPKVTLQALPAAPRMTTKKSLDLNIVYTRTPSIIRAPAAATM